MGYPDHDKESSSLLSQIPTRPPNSHALLAWVKITQLNQSHTNTQESFVRKVSLWWGEPFEIKREFSLGDRAENPCVGGSIPPRATKKHQNHLRVVFSFGLRRG